MSSLFTGTCRDSERGAEAREIDEAPAPGTVISIDDDAIVIGCGEGALALTQLLSLTGAALTSQEAVSILDLKEGAIEGMMTLSAEGLKMYFAAGRLLLVDYPEDVFRPGGS